MTILESPPLTRGWKTDDQIGMCVEPRVEERDGDAAAGIAIGRAQPQGRRQDATRHVLALVRRQRVERRLEALGALCAEAELGLPPGGVGGDERHEPRRQADGGLGGGVLAVAERTGGRVVAQGGARLTAARRAVKRARTRTI